MSLTEPGNAYEKYSRLFHNWGLKYCCYCNEPLNFNRRYAVEHLIPFSLGGDDCLENIAPCCLLCNGERSSKNYPVWIEEMKNAVDFLTPGQQVRRTMQIENATKWMKYTAEAGDRLYSPGIEIEVARKSYCQ